MWSRARRLSQIIKDLFYMSAPFDYILVPVWISTTENVGADALSRGNIDEYMQWATRNVGGGLAGAACAEPLGDPRRSPEMGKDLAAHTRA